MSGLSDLNVGRAIVTYTVTHRAGGRSPDVFPLTGGWVQRAGSGGLSESTAPCTSSSS
jgi:hypothetical protein